MAKHLNLGGWRWTKLPRTGQRNWQSSLGCGPSRQVLFSSSWSIWVHFSGNIFTTSKRECGKELEKISFWRYRSPHCFQLKACAHNVDCPNMASQHNAMVNPLWWLLSASVISLCFQKCWTRWRAPWWTEEAKVQASRWKISSYKIQSPCSI